MTDLQKTVIDAATSSLQHHRWFKGVCLDRLPADEDIHTHGLQWAIDELCVDTTYWDAPWWWGCSEESHD